MNKPRVKMSRQNRAKQFAPFSALSGLDAAIARKEAEYYRKQRITLSEDAEADLDRKLRSLVRGEKVCLRYYFDGEYHDISGEYVRTDTVYGAITIDRTPVRICDIVAVKVL